MDPDKKFSWPTYITVVGAKKHCVTIVLVVAPDAGEAAWAAENIDLGLGLGNVEPLVLGPAVVPEITDLADAEKETELAVLSAVAHGNGPNGLTVVHGDACCPWRARTRSLDGLLSAHLERVA
ncbi:MAG TPA: hypothetical protein VL242_00395 [Sorangium sp.]|nr:hypothetical protein [Sorangium sp.]